MKKEFQIGPLIFRKINLEEHSETCLKFRADSFYTSFGAESAFWGDDGKGGVRYLEWLKTQDSREYGAFHIWKKDEIIGQMELGFLRDDRTWGYINLFYLRVEERGKGYSKYLDDFAIQFLQNQGVHRAKLSVSPTNERAWHYYLKNGWRDGGLRSFEGKKQAYLLHWMLKEF